MVDEQRDIKYTNKYTVAQLFPNENPADALRRELLTLTEKDYINTVKDLKYPKRSEMRVFGKSYEGYDDVYVKIRIELIGYDIEHTAFVMSFHFAEWSLNEEDFPYGY